MERAREKARSPHAPLGAVRNRITTHYLISTCRSTFTHIPPRISSHVTLCMPFVRLLPRRRFLNRETGVENDRVAGESIWRVKRRIVVSLDYFPISNDFGIRGGSKWTRFERDSVDTDLWRVWEFSLSLSLESRSFGEWNRKVEIVFESKIFERKRTMAEYICFFHFGVPKFSQLLPILRYFIFYYTLLGKRVHGRNV